MGFQHIRPLMPERLEHLAQSEGSKRFKADNPESSSITLQYQQLGSSLHSFKNEESNDAYGGGSGTRNSAANSTAALDTCANTMNFQQLAMQR